MKTIELKCFLSLSPVSLQGNTIQSLNALYVSDAIITVCRGTVPTAPVFEEDFVSVSFTNRLPVGIYMIMTSTGCPINISSRIHISVDNNQEAEVIPESMISDFMNI